MRNRRQEIDVVQDPHYILTLTDPGKVLGVWPKELGYDSGGPGLWPFRPEYNVVHKPNVSLALRVHTQRDLDKVPEFLKLASLCAGLWLECLPRERLQLYNTVLREGERISRAMASKYTDNVPDPTPDWGYLKGITGILVGADEWVTADENGTSWEFESDPTWLTDLEQQAEGTGLEYYERNLDD